MRYALVLYGGVSLAVYINGVVQEFFRLVRSTAPEWPLATEPTEQRAWFPAEEGGRGKVKPLRGTERVYRRLGQLLPIQAEASSPPFDAPIRTRFVVDILSGTSAGGLNGIVLAKALANQQSLGGLRKLWLDDGDIDLLLNDEKSIEGLSLSLKSPPPSLLNGDRFYVKALATFDTMNGTEEEPWKQKSPSYAEQIDLAVTTTDLQGLVLPIRLADRVIYEARHKNVFRFAYWTKEATGTDRNDFGPENDRMLAFAARCTSSFPFAFEPMILDDVGELVPDGLPAEPWPQFFGDYRGRAEYRRFSYADGGYLDNKPFTYATEQLARRRADVPVVRRLVYVEPDPSEPVLDLMNQKAKERPDVLTNVKAAVTDLPRAETIRDDVEAVVDRSRAIRRARKATAVVVEDALKGAGKPLPKPTRAYYALRCEVFLDDLVEAVARAAGVADDADAVDRLRLLADGWARRHSHRELFAAFDLGFRLRRLTFLQHRLNDLLRGQGLREVPAGAEPLLRKVKMALNEIFIELRWRGRGVRQPLRTVKQLTEEQKKTLSRAPQDDAARFKAVAEAVERIAPAEGVATADDFDAVAAALKAVFDLPFRAAEAAARLVLGPPPTDDAATKEARAWMFLEGEEKTGSPAVLEGLDKLPGDLRDLLRWYYDQFERIDAMLLPLTYPDLGEVNPVDVMRISPQDATWLIDERDKDEKRRKLAGTSMHHFGGFLEREFRLNDMLWGRLDGAEHIIVTTLGPEHDQTALLVEAAHLAIIREELLGAEGPPWVRDVLANAGAAEPSQSARTDQLRELLGPDWSAETLQAAQAVRAYLGTTYEIDRTYNWNEHLDLVARATSITGGVVKRAAGSYKRARRPLLGLARAAGLAGRGLRLADRLRARLGSRA